MTTVQEPYSEKSLHVIMVHCHCYVIDFLKVLFNLLNLVGLARASHDSMRYNGLYESIMLVNDRDIQVPLEECISGQCEDCQSQLVRTSSVHS